MKSTSEVKHKRHTVSFVGIAACWGGRCLVPPPPPHTHTHTHAHATPTPPPLPSSRFRVLGPFKRLVADRVCGVAGRAHARARLWPSGAGARTLLWPSRIMHRTLALARHVVKLVIASTPPYDNSHVWPRRGPQMESGKCQRDTPRLGSPHACHATTLSPEP